MCTVVSFMTLIYSCFNLFVAEGTAHQNMKSLRVGKSTKTTDIGENG